MGLAVPSPVGRERGRVRDILFEIRSCPALVVAQTLRLPRRRLGARERPGIWHCVNDVKRYQCRLIAEVSGL